MDKTLAVYNNFNEYSFRWGKQFGFLTLKTLDTKLNINKREISIETDRYFFGFIKGKKTTMEIPLVNIDYLEMKTLLSFPDLSVAGGYVLGGMLNPLFFLIVPLSVWACINTNILIYTKAKKVIKIPSFSKKDAKEFMNYFSDIYLEN